MSLLLAVSFGLLGYLLGAVPAGLVVARLRGVDIRQVGSGNIGATNVLRAVGPGAAAVVAILDPLKGALAVLVPTLLGLDPWTVAFIGFATVLGNDYNVFLRFGGGKGVATSFGVFLVVDPTHALVGLAVALIAMVIGRYVSLGSLVGASSVPLMLLASGAAAPVDVTLAATLVALMFVRHRENLVRLAAGTERRLGTPRDAG
ncbi:MAG: glycerol-3-phosphate 1-O-acyltransferase PlsY [Trueperaceae bacterium]|nr:glycerol-3-phosphate 1-O-acyltransferase PlsY [Trueperaceae bacterium]